MLCAGGVNKGSCYVRLDIKDLVYVVFSGGQWRSFGCGGGVSGHRESWRIRILCQGSHFKFDLNLSMLSQESVFDIYTDVVLFMPWINSTILSMGGMQACDIKLDVSKPKGDI